MNKTKIFAHRGASDLVKFENTIDAFQKAIEVNSDGIELDVRKTIDNVIVVNHNPDVDGLIVSDHTYQELLDKSLSIGYKIPTLEETLVFCQNKIFLDIEVKEPGFEQELITLVKRYLNYDQFFIRSFIESIIIKTKEIDSNIKTVLLISPKKLKEVVGCVFPGKKIKRTKCDIISPHRHVLHHNFINRMHRKNILVSVWTVNEDKEMLKFIKKKADFIITNYPDKAKNLLK